jgi:hypothetical protein
MVHERWYGMSNVDDDVAGLGLRALRTARIDGLRRRMNEFVETHDSGGDLRELRAGISSETAMSDLVVDGRDERI